MQIVTSETRNGSAAALIPVTTTNKVAQEAAEESEYAENYDSPAVRPTDAIPNGEFGEQVLYVHLILLYYLG